MSRQLGWVMLIVVAVGYTPVMAQEVPIEILIKQLGAVTLQEREEAERKILINGPLAIPALEQALKDTDPEVQARAGGLIRTIRLRERTARLTSALSEATVKERPRIIEEATSSSEEDWLRLLRGVSGLDVMETGSGWIITDGNWGRTSLSVTRRDFSAIVDSYVDGAWESPKIRTLIDGIAARCGVALDPRQRAEDEPRFRIVEDTREVSICYGVPREGAVRRLSGKRHDPFQAVALRAFGVEKPEAVAALLELLKHRDKNVRGDALRLLMERQARDATKVFSEVVEGETEFLLWEDLLVRMYEDRDCFIRQDAFKALVDSGAEQAVRVAERALYDEDVRLRRDAVRYVRNRKLTSWSAKVAPLLQDSYSPIRVDAIETLAEIDPVLAQREVPACLQDRECRETAMKALARLGAEGIRDYLNGRLDDLDPKTRETAAQCLELLNTRR